MKTYKVTVDNDGTKRWYNEQDELHREDGPVVEWADGSKEWWLNDQLHREDGPAIERANGTKWWYLNGRLHREGGPAVEWASGTKSWYLNGKLHREDGPAIERANGAKSWYLNGECVTAAEFNARTRSTCDGKVVEIDGKRYKLQAL